jgi:transposase
VRCNRRHPADLPPYSPDFNPIEQSFAKLKVHLCKAKERNIPALYNRIRQALKAFQPHEFHNYFRNWIPL